MSESQQNTKLKRIPTKSPTINLFDLPYEFDKVDLVEKIFSQNIKLKQARDNAVTDEDRKFEVLIITRQRNGQRDRYRATLRVSNAMRSALQRQGDVIALGINEHRLKDSF